MGFTTPEIVAIPIENGDADYLAWIDAETSAATPDPGGGASAQLGQRTAPSGRGNESTKLTRQGLRSRALRRAEGERELGVDDAASG